MKEMRIVFMGTPEFAVAILDRIYLDGYNIVGVITAPDKPAGRGRNISESAVKKYATSKGLNLLQPTNLKDPKFIEALSELNGDLFVVVAFRMLPEIVWSMPPKGTINLHASLLPNYRGAAPINWAVINGETKTGVTTFFIEKEIDTGAIIEQAETTIGINEKVGDLYERLMQLGADLVSSTLNKIELNQLEGTPQSQIHIDNIKDAPKIFKDDCEIDFNKGADEVHNFCRGLSPYPAAWCNLYNKDKNEKKSFKIFTTRKTDIPSKNTIGITSDKEGLLFPTNDFYIRVLEIQPEGKRRMSFQDFMAGNSIDSFEIQSKQE